MELKKNEMYNRQHVSQNGICLYAIFLPKIDINLIPLGEIVIIIDYNDFPKFRVHRSHNDKTQHFSFSGKM